MSKYVTLPTGQRSYPPEMKYDIVRNGERMYLQRNECWGRPLDTLEDVEAYLTRARSITSDTVFEVIECELKVEPMWHVELREAVKPGVIVENCSCQAVRVTQVDEDGYLHCVSIHNGRHSNCDLYHCGIVVLTPEEIERKKAIYEACATDEEGIKALIDDWRNRVVEPIKE